jgi:hypothetical protein
VTVAAAAAAAAAAQSCLATVYSVCHSDTELAFTWESKREPSQTESALVNCTSPCCYLAYVA